MEKERSTAANPRGLDGPIVSRPRNQKKGKTLEQHKDESIGKVGTLERDEYEAEFKMDAIQEIIRNARKKRKLSQEELGEIVGVKKSHISRLEKGYNNTSISLLSRVFKALDARVMISIQLEDQNFELV